MNGLDVSFSYSRASIALIRVLQPSPQILVMERAHHPKDPWSGQLCFPGGRRENSDLNLLETCIRETWEELGFELSCRNLVDVSPHRYAGHYSGRVIGVSMFGFDLEEVPQMSLNPSECENVHWVRESEFLDSSNHPSKSFHPKIPHSFPYFQVNDKKKLWGFTYEQLQLFYWRRGKLSHSPKFPRKDSVD